MEPLLEGLLRSLGGSEANFLELCFRGFLYGYVYTKATSKKSGPPSGNFRPNPRELPRSPSRSFFQPQGGLEDSLRILLEFYGILITFFNFNFLAVPFGRVPFRFFQ